MKRHTVIIVLLLTLIICISGFLILHQHQTFRLDSEYYDQAEIQDLTLEQLRELIAKHKTFALLAYQSGCQTSAELSRNVRQFSEQYSLKIYRIVFSELKNSGLVEGLRFYPTFVIYHDGEVVDFLAADATEDTSAYTSLDGFTEWFSKYVEF